MKAIPAPTTNGAGVTSAPVRLPVRKPAKLPALPQPPTLLAAIIQASSDPDRRRGQDRELVELHKTCRLASGSALSTRP